MHYQFFCAPKLDKKYEIAHCSRSSKTINWSAESFEINHVISMSWHMSPRCGHGILVSGYPVLTAVKLWMSYIKDVDLPRLDWDTPPFLLIVSPTPPVQSVDAYERSVISRNNQRKRGWPYSMSMGSVPRALRVCPRGHLEVRCPVEKKNISVVKNIALMQWKGVAKAI